MVPIDYCMPRVSPLMFTCSLVIPEATLVAAARPGALPPHLVLLVLGLPASRPLRTPLTPLILILLVPPPRPEEEAELLYPRSVADDIGRSRRRRPTMTTTQGTRTRPRITRLAPSVAATRSSVGRHRSRPTTRTTNINLRIRILPPHTRRKRRRRRARSIRRRLNRAHLTQRYELASIHCNFPLTTYSWSVFYTKVNNINMCGAAS